MVFGTIPSTFLWDVVEIDGAQIFKLLPQVVDSLLVLNVVLLPIPDESLHSLKNPVRHIITSIDEKWCCF